MGGGAGGDRADEMLTIPGAAMEWRRSNEEAEAVLSGLDPARWKGVRYEDLCADPERGLGRGEALSQPLGVDLPGHRVDGHSPFHEGLDGLG